MGSAKVYFVLYIVLLCELFMVIQDRDNAQDAWSKQFKDHINEYRLDFAGLKDTSFVTASEKGNFKIVLFLNGMVTDQEKKDAQLSVSLWDGKTEKSCIDSFTIGSNDFKETIDSTTRKASNKAKDTVYLYVSKRAGIEIKKTNGLVYELSGKVSGESLVCKAFFKTKRQLPSYLPDDVKQVLGSTVLHELKYDKNLNGTKTLSAMIEGKVDSSLSHTIYINNNHGPIKKPR